MYEVLVENVGIVYHGDDETKAQDTYDSYAGKYRPLGCAWFANVIWLDGLDIKAEFFDPNGPAGD